ncbi:hypothetical protein EBH_0070050 [Eimeria brunetti]|uniref:Uncharacterized protein n=1 Tax=Eimeria brunetti TaxID=51314 RepID=U6L9B7_9EIME|nr:hypothetical protein EBH_0070050 [Eimeria brunetti]
MNRHEEALLSLSDLRHEWDLRIGLLESCLRQVQTIGAGLAPLGPDQWCAATVRPSFFRQTHVSCLRRIFGDNTEQVLSCLCCAPAASLPLILSTLQAKLLQWRAMGQLLGAYWTALEGPHFAGALDFRRKMNDAKRSSSSSSSSSGSGSGGSSSGGSSSSSSNGGSNGGAGGVEVEEGGRSLKMARIAKNE